MTQQQMTMAAQPTLLIEGPFCGVAPKPEYWQAILKAKKDIGPILKEHKLGKDAGKKAGRAFSSVDDWIEQCDDKMQACGLIFQQTSTIEGLEGTGASGPGGRGARVKASIRFLVIHAETGTGMIYRMDWPLWGGNSGTSANEDTGAALSWACKYGLRAILFLPQMKDDVAVAQRDFERQAVERDRRKQEQQRRQAQPQRQAPVDHAKTERLPPVEEEPMVKAAQAALGAQAVEDQPAPDHDPTFEELTKVCGWEDSFARQLCAVGADEPVSPGLAKQFQDRVYLAKTSYFRGDVSRANEYWGKNHAGPATGFIPAPGTGKLPTGAQIRRYCAKLKWNNQRAAAAQGA